MANEAQTDQEKEFRKRARRRLIGAVALVLLMVTVLPMLLDDRSGENTPRPDVIISIPSHEDAGFSPRIVPTSPPVESAPPVEVLAPEPLPPPPQEPVNPPVADAKPATPALPPDAVKIEPPKPAPQAKPESKSRPEEKPTLASRPAARQGSVSVQVGVFTPSPKADQMQSRLSGLGLGCGTETLTASNGNKLLRMRCGPFDSKEAAVAAQQKLKSAGFANTILVVHGK